MYLTPDYFDKTASLDLHQKRDRNVLILLIFCIPDFTQFSIIDSFQNAYIIWTLSDFRSLNLSSATIIVNLNVALCYCIAS